MRNHHHHLLCILSPSLSLLFFFFSFSFSGSFHGVHSKFPANCYPDSPLPPCGNIPIRYPFWMVISDRDAHCSYSGFGLHYRHGSVLSTLSLMGSAYYITNINYNNQTLTLVDMYIDIGQGCPRARHNFTLDSLPPYY